jgi:hypothetical protein
MRDLGEILDDHTKRRPVGRQRRVRPARTGSRRGIGGLVSTTGYQAKYFAYDLTKRCPPESAERLAGAVASAQVDLNPHHVDAALFAKVRCG